MFQRMLASVGIGAAKVDTILQQNEYVAGEEVKGIVSITGGSVEQNIDSIYLTLYASYTREMDDRKVSARYTMEKLRLTEPIVIQPGEKRDIPFSFTLPIETPLTFGMKRVWLQTGLDIKNSVDPGDTDYIQVLPNPLVNEILQAVQRLGFRLHKAECEELPHRLRKNVPFAQEFEFLPVTGPYYRKLDEVELLMLPKSQSEIDIVMEVDRKARGLGSFFAEALDMDESRVRFTVTASDIPMLEQKIGQLISRYC